MRTVEPGLAAACIASVESAGEAQRRMAEAYPHPFSIKPRMTATEIMRARQWFRDGQPLAAVAWRLGYTPADVRRGTPGLEW